MTLHLKLPADVEARIHECAAATGQDVETFLLRAVQDKLAAAEPEPTEQSARNGSDWPAELDAWIASHPVVSHDVDESRETIYGNRDE